jgi:site-specific DNA-cytosine methylase
MRHGSLFSGIGGFDLAAEWMGWGGRMFFIANGIRLDKRY